MKWRETRASLFGPPSFVMWDTRVIFLFRFFFPFVDVLIDRGWEVDSKIRRPYRRQTFPSPVIDSPLSRSLVGRNHVVVVVLGDGERCTVQRWGRDG